MGLMAQLDKTNLYVEVTQLRIFAISCKRHGTHPQTVVSRRQFLQFVWASIVEKLTAGNAFYHGAVLYEQKKHLMSKTETGQDILEAPCPVSLSSDTMGYLIYVVCYYLAIQPEEGKRATLQYICYLPCSCNIVVLCSCLWVRSYENVNASHNSTLCCSYMMHVL